MTATLARLMRGEVVAIKGLGGFHLACNARDAAAVARLRVRKAREEKPFAVMVAGVASARRHADVSSAERALLESAERPVVLLRKRPDVDRDLVDVAPGLAWLGAMLPYTPLHYLLFHEAAGRPAGTGWLADAQDLVLVMTSANPGGEPLVTDNDEALARLAGIADAFLVHDRAIVIRCDDSVVRAGATGPQFVRRARGYTPLAIRLAAPGPSVAAVGGWYKNTVCVTRGDEAFVSQHIGDLDNAPTCAALEEALAHLVAILDVRPEAVAHDLHPDFFSTRHAAKLAARWGVPLVGVQHHHAHIAAVLAEHRVTAPTLGLALDGVGLGTDGDAWGGELLRVEGRAQRADRPPASAAPAGRRSGGARALANGGRGAVARGTRAGHRDALRRRTGRADGGANACAGRSMRPETSSMGRWFDAAAGLLGVKRRIAFEGQAAMLLEGLAESAARSPPTRSLFAITPDNELDLTPLVARLATRGTPAFGAALFHATVVAALAAWVEKAARRTANRDGGVRRRLLPQRDRVPRAAPPRSRPRASRCSKRRRCRPTTAGLSLGQAWVARQAVERQGLTMCLAIPARVVSLVAPDAALIDVGGVRKEVSLALVDGVAPGDYVIVHVGYALTKLDPDEAARTLEAVRRSRPRRRRGAVKYIDEFRDGDLARGLAAAIGARRARSARYHLMEFCGGHTHAISRYGLTDLLPDNVRMVHGPGCPVCVLPIGRIDSAIELASRPGLILCTYADTMRVPASKGLSLLKAKARGADIRMVYSSADALRIAREHPGRDVVFFAIGFETTTPPTAVAIRQADTRGALAISASSATTC